MGKSKPKTRAQADRERDLRLQRTYGITSAEYEKLLESNNGNCWICNFPPNGNRLAVEHDHSHKKVKVAKRKFDEKTWYASGTYNGVVFDFLSTDKAEAVREVKRKLLRASVRGLACVWCNRGLKFYHDESKRLRNAAQYLDDFLAGKTRQLLNQA